MLESYEDDGVVKKAFRVGGVKVGDYIVILTSDDWAIANEEDFGDFALAYGSGSIEKSIKPEYMFQAVKILEEAEPSILKEEVRLNGDWKKLLMNAGGVATFLDSGEIVPGVEPIPPRVKCAQVRGCKPEDVVPRLRELGGIDCLLLGEASGDAA